MKVVRMNRQIDRLEKDPRAQQDYAVQAKIRSLAAQVPSQEKAHDMKRCPHCFRTFNPKAAARHIPACKNTYNRPKAPPTMQDVI